MLAEVIFPIPLNKSFYYSIPEEMELVAAPGLRVYAPLRNQQATGIIIKVLAEKDADLSNITKIKNIKSIIDDEPVFEEPVLELAKRMERRWGGSFGLCAGEFYVNVSETMSHRFPAWDGQPADNLNIPDDINFPSPDKAFSSEELLKIGNIFSSIQNKKNYDFIIRLPLEKKHILAGLMAKKTNECQILFLVPDQEYASYAYRELLPFFGDTLGLWHSQISAARKKETAINAANGKIRFLIGTRTAAFLPFEKLRLAIIDADNETCFRNEERAPLYNAAEVLQWRMRETGGSTMLCALCPSAENYGRAFSGKYHIEDLTPNKDSLAADNENTSEIVISDMEKDYMPGSVFSEKTEKQIIEAACSGKKIAVIAPRKGYASKLFCSGCGKMLRCPDCGPGLALIKGEDGNMQMLCRKCGKKYPFPEKCPVCGKTRFRELGTGTQKAQAYLQKMLGGINVIRYDGDILRGSAKKKEEMLNSFFCGETNIITSTKIALNLLRPESIDMMIFLDAEEDLSGPDFRSAEKMMRTVLMAKSLMKPGGSIILQTREPDNFIFSAISNNSYNDFCKEELEARKFFRYPPYSRLLLVRFAAKQCGAVKSCGERLNSALKRHLAAKKIELQGPVIPRGQENKSYFSEYWLIKSFEEKTAEEVLQKALYMPQIENVKYFIVPDPQDFP